MGITNQELFEFNKIYTFYCLFFLAAVTPRRRLFLEWETLPNNQNKRGKRKSC